MTPFRRRGSLWAFVSCLLAALWLSPAWAQSTMVRLFTTQGPIDLQLYDTDTPKTVANFLGYVRRGDFADTFVHRSVANFVIQTGGYAFPPSGYAGHIPTQAPVVNEFSATRSNLRGTIAMAKTGGNPDSATSEWFVNLGNNAANLDTQNGGFTVFGRVTAPSMATVEKIAALPKVNAGGALAALPVVDFTGGSVQRANVVLISSVAELPPRAQSSTADRVFDYLEAAYPQYLSPSRGVAGVALGYTFRHYAQSNAYVGVKDAKVWYLVPSISQDIGLLGELSDWLSLATQAGY